MPTTRTTLRVYFLYGARWIGCYGAAETLLGALTLADRARAHGKQSVWIGSTEARSWRWDGEEP